MGRSAAAPRSTTRRRRDGETLRFLVLAPFLGVVAADLHDVVGRLLRIALVVELDRTRHAVVLHFADRRGDRLARGGLAALGDVLQRPDGDGGGDVGLGGVRLGILAVLLLELLAELLGLRAGGRSRGRGVVRAHHHLAADLDEVRGVHAVGAEELRLHAFLARLLEEGRALVVDPAEIDEVGILGLDRGDDRVEVRLLLRALEADDLHALLLEVVLERLRDALAVGRLVVQHVGRLDFQGAGGELGAHRALHVVAPADAIDVGIPAVGDLLVGVRRRDHRERVFLVDLRRGDGDAGVQVADDDHDVLVGDDVLRVGHADVGLGLVVVGHQLDPEAGLLQVALELLDGELRAELDALAERRLAAAERALRRDLDRSLALGGGP